MIYADRKTHLVELLMKQAQMSIAASIESRVPFLDHQFVATDRLWSLIKLHLWGDIFLRGRPVQPAARWPADCNLAAPRMNLQ
jgi:hypothetical protein